MGEAEKVIQTRQETEIIPFDGAEIDALGILESAVRRSEGYDALIGIISANEAFTLEILGAPAVPISGDVPQEGPGTFILLYTDASVADAETGRQVVIVDRQVLSAYTKLRITAGGAPISGLEATVDLVAVYGWKRVDAQVVLPPLSSVSINDAGGGTTEVSVKTPGTAIPATDGSILVGGVDQTGAQQPLEVILTGGIFRLAVDAIISGPAGAFAQGDFDSVAVDEATATAQWVRAAVTGRDTSAAVGSQNVPVEARSAAGAEVATLIRLHTASWGQSYNLLGGDIRGNVGIITDVSSGLLTQVSADARDSGYVASALGRRYSFTHQTPGTLITAQATFVATTPTLLLYNSAGNGTVIVLRTVRVVVLEATTAPVMICVAIDTADRFSAGGTVITGQNWNEDSATAYPGTAFRFNPTATAAGAGTRYLWTDAIPTGMGGSITISFKDGIVVAGVGSILVYCWDSAGLNGADIVEDIEVEAV